MAEGYVTTAFTHENKRSPKTDPAPDRPSGFLRFMRSTLTSPIKVKTAVFPSPLAILMICRYDNDTFYAQKVGGKDAEGRIEKRI